MAERHDGMVDVELDDEPDPSARSAGGRHDPSLRHPVHSAPPTPAVRRLRQALALRAIGLAVVVGALAIAALTVRDAAQARADDGRVAAAAATTLGLVPSLRAPLRERWRGPGSTEIVGDLALRAEESAGLVRTVARDVTTGATLWVMPRSLTPGNRPPGCRSLGGAPRGLACEVPGRPGIEAANTDEALGSTPGFLVVLDGVRGTATEVAVLPVGTVGWDVVDGDVVLARLADGALEVERVDPTGHVTRWTGTAPLPAGVLARQLRLRVADGFVLVDGAASAVLAASDGALLGAVPAESGGGVLLSTDGLGFTVWQGSTGTWHDRAGRAGEHLSGEPIELAVDDRSGGALMLVRNGSSVVGVEVVETGLAWNRGPVDRVLLRLDGQLLLDEGGVLRAVDAATGAHRWSVAASLGDVGGDAVSNGEVSGSVVSDGVRVLAVVPGPGTAGPRLSALDLADGHIVWSVPMPAGTTAISARDGTVVALGEGTVAVLG